MLSTQSADIVRATLPVVGAHLDEITSRFYSTMFSERPELLDGLFNRGNQANGEQRRALAGSIAGFAEQGEARLERLVGANGVGLAGAEEGESEGDQRERLA